jgi:hypothetical protein
MATSIFSKMPPLRPRRRIPDSELTGMWRKHAHQVGEVITAWNDLQGSLYWIFKDIINDTPDVALAIWHTIASDRIQRDMLMSIAEIKFSQNSRVYKQIKWVKERADDLSPYRNDPSHTQMAFLITDSGNMMLGPDESTGKTASVERLKANPLNQTYRKLRGDFQALSEFSLAISVYIRVPDRASLPYRPRLLSIPTKKPKRSQKRRRREKSSTRTQP